MNGPEPHDAERIEARPGVAERCYRRLLRAYPLAYRAAYGEEIVGTLLEVSAGRGRPSVREAAGLVRGGLAARLHEHTAHPTPWWADGLALGAFLIALNNLVADLANQGFAVISSLLLVAALMRGRFRVALAVALAVALIQALGVGRWLISGVLAGDLPSTSIYGGVIGFTAYAVMVAALIVLVVRRPPRPRSRSWWWLATLAVMSMTRYMRMPTGILSETLCALGDGCSGGWVTTYAPTFAEVYIPLTMLLLSGGIWAAAVTRDLRWSIAATFFLLANAGPYVLHTMAGGLGPAALAAALWGVQALLVGAMIVTARRGVRARA
ncbi:hypothetical protein [Actinoallomurus sp. NPDC050550]|uniref:hypothetical protein n=1 Tax=Actinoallomurus sp. NPDC050550 TaxID=3154937 RepID=UPI0033DCC80C